MLRFAKLFKKEVFLENGTKYTISFSFCPFFRISNIIAWINLIKISVKCTFDSCVYVWAKQYKYFFMNLSIRFYHVNDIINVILIFHKMKYILKGHLRLHLITFLFEYPLFIRIFIC